MPTGIRQCTRVRTVIAQYRHRLTGIRALISLQDETWKNLHPAKSGTIIETAERFRRVLFEIGDDLAGIIIIVKTNRI